MPLSISNSNSRIPSGPYGRQWLLTIGLFILTVASGEYYFRFSGYRPSVKDTPALWAYNRNRCQTESSSDMVAVLGDSRMQVGFSPSVFSDTIACNDVVMLPIGGSYCLSVMKDIALHSEFRGVVLCSVMEFHFLGIDNKESEYHLKCYHDLYSDSKFSGFFKTINTLCNREIESCLAVTQIHPERIMKAVSKPSPSYYNMKKSRYRPADYRGRLSVEQLQELRDRRLVGVTSVLSGPERTEDELISKRSEWMKCVGQVWEWAKIIEDRGGRVILIRFPTSGKRLDCDLKLYPKEIFWDYAAMRSPIEMIHFLDVPGADKFECPDTSHLNYDDGEKFTAMIAEELIAKGLLKSQNVPLP